MAENNREILWFDEPAVEWEEAKRLLSGFPDDMKAYVRLSVLSDGPLPPGAIEEAARIAAGKECRFCGINQKRSRQTAHSAKVFTVQEFKELDPLLIARQYAEEEGLVFDSDMERMLGDVIRMVREEEK